MTHEQWLKYGRKNEKLDLASSAAATESDRYLTMERDAFHDAKWTGVHVENLYFINKTRRSLYFMFIRLGMRGAGWLMHQRRLTPAKK